MLLEATGRVHKGDLEAVVGTVFSTMMGLEIQPAAEPCPSPAGLLTAAVYLSGEWNGAVCCQFAPPQVCAFTGLFLGMPAPESVDDDARDVMGELANMIAGNLKCAFAPGVRISIPSVTDGAAYNVRVCGGKVVYVATFQTEAGPFWVTLYDTAAAN